MVAPEQSEENMAETPPLIRRLSTRIEENPTPHHFDPFEEVLAVMEDEMERYQDEVKRRYPGDLVDRLFTPDGELDLHIGTTHNLMQKTMPRILHLLGSLFTSKTKNRESTQSLCPSRCEQHSPFSPLNFTLPLIIHPPSRPETEGKYSVCEVETSYSCGRDTASAKIHETGCGDSPL